MRSADPNAAMSTQSEQAGPAEPEPTHVGDSTVSFAESATVGDRPPRSTGEQPASLPDPVGEFIGRYRVVRRLGRGGMGEVFLAEDPVLRRNVAIKRILPGLAHEPSFRARLRREARLAAHLSHRAIIQVFDFVSDETADHVVMEYVAGPSLHTLVRRARLPLAEVIRIAGEILDGLAYAHQHGVIHRDLKLENIVLGDDRQPKIADFGLAHCFDGAGDDSLTAEGLLIGTSRVMSPEQAQGQDVDQRSDLFSFGVMLYELTTGTSPFAAGERLQTILRVLHHRPPPACELVPALPRALSDLIDELLEKAPEQRPDNAVVVRDRLLGGAPAAAPPALAPDEVALGAAPDPALAPVPAGAVAPRRTRPRSAETQPALPVAARDADAARRDPAPARAIGPRRLPNLRGIAVAFAICLAAALLQLVVAWSAGILESSRAQGDPPRIFIGYLASYHWWVTHTVLVPAVSACIWSTWTALGELGTRPAKLARAIALAVALALAAVVVVNELVRVLGTVPLEACQWNYRHCRPSGAAYAPALRSFLVVLGYLHELVGYIGLVFTVSGVLALAWLRRAPGDPAVVRRMAPHLFNQRLAVMGYLVYLLLLRSSKVSLYLTLQGHDDPTIAGMLSRWGTYFNVIAHGMTLNLVAGALWLAAALTAHLSVAHAGLGQALSDDSDGAWRLLGEAARLAGRPFLTFVVAAIVFIVLPPPGWPLLVVVMAAIVALAVWRRR